MNDNNDEPILLPPPQEFASVNDTLEYAKRLGLPNVVVISEYPDGRITYLRSREWSGLQSVVFLLEKFKIAIVTGQFGAGVIGPPPGTKGV